MALNRGYRYRRKATNADDGRRPPEFYVFPVGVDDAHDRTISWGKVFLKRIEDLDGHSST